MEKIKTACPKCKVIYTLNSDTIGKNGKCKNCSTTFTVQPLRQREKVIEFIENPLNISIVGSDSLKIQEKYSGKSFISKQRELVQIFNRIITEYQEAESNANNTLEKSERSSQKMLDQMTQVLREKRNRVSNILQDAQAELEIHYK